MNDRTHNVKRSITPWAMVALGLVAGSVGSELLRATPASAQQGGGGSVPPENILSAGAQRNQMIEAIRAMDTRLGRIEAKLNAPLSVKVLEMPAMKSDNK